MKTRIWLFLAILFSLCMRCTAEQITDSTPITLEAEEHLELSDQYLHVPSVQIGQEAVLDILKDGELTIDEGGVITLEKKAVINIHGTLHGQIADIIMGEESEINVFLSDGALVDAALPEDMEAPYTYYGLNIVGLDDLGSIIVIDDDGNRIYFGNGDKTDSIVVPGEHYTIMYCAGPNKGKQVSFVLDPSEPLNLEEAVSEPAVTAQLSLEEAVSESVVTAQLSLKTADVTEADAEIPFTAALTRPARRDAVVALQVGEDSYAIAIPAGAKSGSIRIANDNTEDPYIDADSLSATVKGISGGGFDRVDFSGASATANISDTIDTTIVSLSASDIKEGEANVTFTVRLSNAAQTDATATVNTGGKTYTVGIPAGATSGSVDVPNTNIEDTYLDESTLTATVTGITGGNFEAVDCSSATVTAVISDTIDTTTVSLSANSIIEGDPHVTFTVTLSNAPQTDAVVTVNVAGTDYTSNISAGTVSGSVDVLNTNGEDPYIDASTLAGTVTGITGGGFEAVDYSSATATAAISDTIDITTVTLSASGIKESDAHATFTVTLSNAAQTDTVVTVNVGGINYTANIAAGAISGSVDVPNTHVNDPYNNVRKLTGKVTGITGGNFEAVDYSNATATSTIGDTTDTTTVSLSASDIKEGDTHVTFTVTLSNAPQTDVTATVSTGDKIYTVSIAAGVTSGSVNVPNTNTEDVYLDESMLTATVTGITGGNFEAVDYSSATATATISDTIDTTTVALSASDIKEGDAHVTFTVTLSNAVQTDAVVTVNVGGTDCTVNISAGTASGSVDVPNTNGDDPYTDASTLTGTVTGITGGSFEAVDYSSATATAAISDTIDTTTVSLSTTNIYKNENCVNFTVSLSNAAQTDAVAKLNVDGKENSVTIPAGKSSATLSVTDPNFIPGKLSATVIGITGGNFEAVNYSNAAATATIYDTNAVVTISATDIEEGGDFVTFTVDLSSPAQTAAVVTVNVGGTDYTVNIPAGATSGSVNVPNTNGEDPYFDASTLTGTVTGLTGGNFEKVDYRSATATATISDTIDTTTVTLSASNISEGESAVTFTVSLSNAAQTAVIVTVNVGGTDYTVNIPASATSGSVNVPNTNGEDPYFDASTLTGTVTGLTGGNFEMVNYSNATATAAISDTINTTTVSLSAKSIKEGDTHVPFTVTLSNAAQTAAVVTVNVRSTDYTVNIAAGATSGSVNVPHNGEDPYIDAITLTGKVTGITGGNFEAVDYSSATATAAISDTIDTTKVSLSANSINGGVTFTVSLSNAAQTAAVVTVNVSGTDYTVNISAGANSGSVTVNRTDYPSLTGTVTGLTGGNFEAVDYSSATATAAILTKVQTMMRASMLLREVVAEPTESDAGDKSAESDAGVESAESDMNDETTETDADVETTETDTNDKTTETDAGDETTESDAGDESAETDTGDETTEPDMSDEPVGSSTVDAPPIVPSVSDAPMEINGTEETSAA